jgi:alkanesulfonate monooxygenase SsuD/methylene tetrahydromethanopterin reductase-like flavin-dependent oxidoreductase (luciferase family)
MLDHPEDDPMPSKPSLGVIFHPKFPLETLVDYARRAEAAGFDELWLWEDCFYGGAFSNAASALAATQRLRVGVGILPATVRNPLFTAMEITSLARLFPGRFMPGFGQGVASWMKQIGAAPKSFLGALEETVSAVRSLLKGEQVTLHGGYVHLDNVQMLSAPAEIPALYVGGIREKVLQLAGRVGDGVILTEMSSPQYVTWARHQIGVGMAEAAREHSRSVVYVFCKTLPNATEARMAARRAIAVRLEASAGHLAPLGITEEAAALVREKGVEGAAQAMPEVWVDALSACGTPEQAAAGISRLADAGADSIVLQPIDGDPTAFEEYLRYLMPLLRG